jgi:hypothetical protein
MKGDAAAIMHLKEKSSLTFVFSSFVVGRRRIYSVPFDRKYTSAAGRKR